LHQEVEAVAHFCPKYKKIFPMADDLLQLRPWLFSFSMFIFHYYIGVFNSRIYSISNKKIQ